MVEPSHDLPWIVCPQCGRRGWKPITLQSRRFPHTTTCSDSTRSKKAARETSRREVVRLAHAKKTLEPGTWYAGYHAPFFVSRSLVAAALGKLGLADVRFFERGTPLPVDPKLDPAYDDQWDTWLEATYAGPSKPVDVPPQVSWLLHSSAGESKPEPLAVPPKAPPAKPASSKVLLVLLVLYLLHEE